MTQFVIRRIFWAIFLFFVATIITYLIFWVIPSDPAALAAGKSATPADIARVRHFLHLDEPIWRQYLRFVWNLVGHGSLGESFARCDKAFAAVTPENMLERATPTSTRSKLGALIYDTQHISEHYGNAVTYLRLQNIVPPSSAPRTGRGAL